mgnify:FL=1
MSQMSDLIASSNKFTGAWIDVREMSQLKNLQIDRNRFSGTLGNLPPNLTMLLVNSNEVRIMDSSSVCLDDHVPEIQPDGRCLQST